jgi:hypothetical protein
MNKQVENEQQDNNSGYVYDMFNSGKKSNANPIMRLGCGMAVG